MAAYTDRRRITAQSRCLGSFSSAFRQLARDMEATAEPMNRLLSRLEDGPAKELLTGCRPEAADDLPEAQQTVIRETASLLGGFDVPTQVTALIRAASLLEAEKAALDRQAPTTLQTRQALLLSGAAITVILLL